MIVCGKFVQSWQYVCSVAHLISRLIMLRLIMLSPIMLMLIGNSRRRPEVLGLLMSHTMVIILLSLCVCGSDYGRTDEIFFVTLDIGGTSTRPDI